MKFLQNEELVHMALLNANLDSLLFKKNTTKLFSPQITFGGFLSLGPNAQGL